MVRQFLNSNLASSPTINAKFFDFRAQASPAAGKITASPEAWLRFPSLFSPSILTKW
jgi:hypothetical protein